MEVHQGYSKGRRGLVPVRMVTVLGEEEIACKTLEQQQQRWRRHFAKLLNMIFTIHKPIEKSWEHRAKSFITFIDLKKAYDSVPRSAMWLALGN